MTFVPADGTQASPAITMQVPSIATVAPGSLPSGSLVRDVSNNGLYLVSNDWAAAGNVSSPIPMGGIAGVTVSTDVAPLTITATDNVGFVVATGVAHQVTLPAAAVSKGRTIRIVAPTGAGGNITVKAAGVELINAANTYVIDADFEQTSLTCDGVQWYAVSSVP